MSTIKHYPRICLSANCGRVDCTGCKYKPALDEFKQWVNNNNAAPVDKIWFPNIYAAGASTTQQQIELFIYDVETLEVVAISKGTTNAECERKARAYLGTDEYGATYSPAFGSHSGLIENANAEIL